MILSTKQKLNLCHRYWKNSETWTKAKQRKGFATLTEGQFNRCTSIWTPTYKELNPLQGCLDWLTQPDDNSTPFKHQTEKDIFDGLCKRKGNPHNIEWGK